jgi:IS5 family transposase
MRKKSSDRELFDQQYRMLEFAMNPKNPLAAELKAIDELLDEIPEMIDLVHSDIDHSKSKKGRRAEISAEQILRSAILMQLRRLHYRELAEEIDVNMLYRKFTRFYGKKIPHYTQLNDLIKALSPRTMARLNATLLQLGIKKKVEDGKAVRFDTTVSETNIAYPVDARLLNDSVRVLDRHLAQLKAAAPGLAFPYHRRTRRAKKRAYQLVMLKGKNVEQRRLRLYEDLLKVQAQVRGYAAGALAALAGAPAVGARLEVMAEAAGLETVLPLAERVYDQARRRVLEGEKVPADEKLVSLFETHTDIICRGKKGSKAEFGHKLNFATGRSGLITWYEVLQGNPGDNELLLGALEGHVATFGQAPQKVTADRRYYSAENETKAHTLGVEQVALPKPGFLSSVRRSLQKARWFRRLLRWRGGIEGCLSTLLRRFGLKRCLWKGWRSFQSYVGLGVLTYNLRLLAGHLTQT